MMRAKVVTAMRRYAQDEVNQEDSEQNEVDGMKKEAETAVASISEVRRVEPTPKTGVF